MAARATDPAHRPVLPAEVVKFLVTDKEGAYLDLTVGLGGHLLVLSDALQSGARLYGFDKDDLALARAVKNLSGIEQKLKLVKASYSSLEDEAPGLEDKQFDGVLLDLGLSSLQLDDPSRGFSFRFDGPLDMCFDPRQPGPTAADLINSYDMTELAEIISVYGEERQANALAEAIVRERQVKMIQTTTDLARIVESRIKGRNQVKSLARVFQAFRIAVNGELDSLAAVLPQTIKHLKAGGRLVVIAYHSLEDRIVKRFLQKEAKGCVCPPRQPICTCGILPTIKILTRHVVTPTSAEQESNSRARSARLRAVERLTT